MKKVFLLLVSALLITSCLPQLPQNIQIPQSPLLPLLERKSGLIGYIGIDGNMYVVNQGGQHPAQLTKDALLPKNQGDPLLLYEYPTWSRDGNQLAFIGLNYDGNQTQSKIMVANVGNKSVNEVFESTSEHPDYLNWSPDSVNLNFISSDSSGQRMVLQSVPARGGTPTIFDVGSPYYWSWAPDGRVMIVHAGGAAGSSPEHISFLSIDSTKVREQVLDSAHVPFQAPAWSPDGSHIALARVTDKENQIIVTDSAGENPKKIGTFATKVAFAWSSDGTRLAYIDSQQPIDPGVVGILHVVDIGTSKEIAEDGNIVAFFWSPSGNELAYFNLVQIQTQSSGSSSGGSSSGSSGDATQQTPPQLGLELHVLDVTTGKSHKLFAYTPTRFFMSILPYFDQYAQSVTIWSPDNNNLVLSVVDNTSGDPNIVVVAPSGRLEPRLLAKGYLGFWSWK